MSIFFGNIHQENVVFPVSSVSLSHRPHLPLDSWHFLHPASCWSQVPSRFSCQSFCARGRCARPSHSLTPLSSSCVWPGRRRNITKAAWNFSTMACGERCAMMTSPSRLPKWCAESSASWTPCPGPLRPSMGEERVRPLLEMFVSRICWVFSTNTEVRVNFSNRIHSISACLFIHCHIFHGNPRFIRPPVWSLIPLGLVSLLEENQDNQFWAYCGGGGWKR